MEADVGGRQMVIEWLLEAENPSVRYHTLRHLLGRTDDHPDVQAARAAIPQSAVVQRIFARQAPEGHWGDPAHPYLPKYKATYWTVMVLGHLAMDRDDARVQRAVEHVFGFQQPEGGFAECGAEGARVEYSRVVARRRHTKPPRDEASFSVDHMRQMTLSCLTGNVSAALLRLGYGDDPRLRRAVQWLAEIQHGDGGWLCPYWKAHIRDRHSCFYGTICALEAFAETPEPDRTPQMQQTIARGAEFLLMHHLYRADHHDWQVINPAWLRLTFPWFYSYHILRGLWVLRRLGVHDERTADAAAVLQGKRTAAGAWVLESTPQGRMQANLEKKGQLSKWITLKALWALD
jgi:hypothetical protein